MDQITRAYKISDDPSKRADDTFGIIALSGDYSDFIRKTLDSLDINIREKGAKIKELERQKAESDAKHAADRAEALDLIKDLKETVTLLTGEISDLTAKNAELEQIREDYDELSSDQQTANFRIEELEKTIKELEKTIEEGNARRFELVGDNNELKRKLNAILQRS